MIVAWLIPGWSYLNQCGRLEADHNVEQCSLNNDRSDLMTHNIIHWHGATANRPLTVLAMNKILEGSRPWGRAEGYKM